MFTTIMGAVVTALCVAVVILTVKLWPTLKTMLPSWATTILVTMADVFVRWAEQAYQGEQGDDKFFIVLEKLEAYLSTVGIQIDTDVIQAAIEAAWSKMNAEQLAVGLKQAPGQDQSQAVCQTFADTH